MFVCACMRVTCCTSVVTTRSRAKPALMAIAVIPTNQEDDNAQLPQASITRVKVEEKQRKATKLPRLTNVAQNDIDAWNTIQNILKTRDSVRNVQSMEVEDVLLLLEVTVPESTNDLWEEDSNRHHHVILQLLMPR